MWITFLRAIKIAHRQNKFSKISVVGLVSLEETFISGKDLFAAFYSYLRDIFDPLNSWKVTIIISIIKVQQVLSMNVNTVERFGKHFWETERQI